MFLPLALVGFLALFGFHTETIVTSVGEAPTETALAEKQASLKEDRLPQMTDENVGADGSVQKISEQTDLAKESVLPTHAIRASRSVFEDIGAGARIVSAMPEKDRLLLLKEVMQHALIEKNSNKETALTNTAEEEKFKGILPVTLVTAWAMAAQTMIHAEVLEESLKANEATAAVQE